MKRSTSTIPRALVAAGAVAALSCGVMACSDDDSDPDDIDNPVDSVDDQVDSIVEEDIGDTNDE
jgi:hypothetical protein